MRRVATDTETPSFDTSPRRRNDSDPELDALYKRVGGKLREYQEMAGLTQRSVCEEIFGSAKRQGEWSRWVRGKILPNVGTLHRIARYFGVSLADLGLFEAAPPVNAVEIESARDHLKRAIALLTPG